MQLRPLAYVAAVFCVYALALPYLTPVATASSVSLADAMGPTVDRHLGSYRVGLKTDADTKAKEAEAASGEGLSAKQQKIVDDVAEKYEFQAEVGRLMDILINSLYQRKEIFLREVISNASDALDKIRFLSVSDDKQLGDGANRELEIRVSFDKEERTLSIRDRGIGMTKQDLIQNLGTIAKSGTAQFVESIAAGGDLSLIGQFGVGFYSVYLVADKVRVTTKHNDDKQYVWESSADGSFTIHEDTGASLGRGTDITLFLKEDATEFVEQAKLEELLRRYSQFITFPIYLKSTKQESYEVPVEEEEEEASVDEDEDLKAADEEEADDKPKTKTESRTVVDWRLINNQKAIWTRSKESVTDEEYNNFYKAITKDTEDPATWIHFTAEGEIEFKSILYVPSKAPSDLYDDYYGKSGALRLYVRKVLISDEFEDLMPKYLNFIKGVVDSDDLPLNVSRETLQQSKVLKVMGKKLVRKVLEMLKQMASGAKAGAEGEEEKKEDAAAEDKKDDKKEDKYIEFWKVFGKNIKLGVIEDSSNRTKLSKLLRFHSSKAATDDEYVSLDQYVARMKDFQKNIFYIAGESLESVKKSPFLDKFKAKDIEVLFLSDPIDEYAIQNLSEYDGKKLQSITKDNVKFGDEGKADSKRESIYKDNFQPLVDFLSTTLGKKVEKVAVSTRLESTPCIISTSQYGYSANMERIMKGQAFSDPTRAQYMVSKKTLEVNPRHPIVAELLKLVQDNAESETAKNTAFLLYDTALINSGFSLEEAGQFSGRIFHLMKTAMNLPSLDLLKDIDVPVEEDDEVPEDDIEAGDDADEL